MAASVLPITLKEVSGGVTKFPGAGGSGAKTVAHGGSPYEAGGTRLFEIEHF